MTLGLDESIAQAMETDVRLLPLLPELLTDLWELGPSAEQVVAALESVGVEPDSTVLDLACGKGAVAVALAEQLGVRVEGIDAFQPFLQAARALATERGVADRCRFEQGDIRSLLGQERQYDVALLLSVGPVSGDYEQTMAGLRRLVRAGGYMVIEDGFLADGVAQPPLAEGYAGHSETLRRLTACGDAVAQEVICPTEQARAVNQKNNALIRRRARLVRARHPAFEQLIDEYVARQERETQLLGTDVRCAIWVLRRAQRRSPVMRQPFSTRVDIHPGASMAADPVTVVITYHAQPGQGARALKELSALIREVVAREPECSGIRLHQDPDDDTRLLLYEGWSSRAAYSGSHMQTPHLAAFMARAREFLAGPPTIEFWRLDADVASGRRA